MKILIMSDSHGMTEKAEEIILTEKPDLLLHLGDYTRDLDILTERHPELEAHSVKGNCDLRGGTPEENAAITRAILSGEERGAKRNAVLLNAGAALYLADLAQSIAEGVKLAAELIDSGKAAAKLDAFIEASNR